MHKRHWCSATFSEFRPFHPAPRHTPRMTGASAVMANPIGARIWWGQAGVWLMRKCGPYGAFDRRPVLPTRLPVNRVLRPSMADWRAFHAPSSPVFPRQRMANPCVARPDQCALRNAPCVMSLRPPFSENHYPPAHRRPVAAVSLGYGFRARRKVWLLNSSLFVSFEFSKFFFFEEFSEKGPYQGSSQNSASEGRATGDTHAHFQKWGM